MAPVSPQPQRPQKRLRSFVHLRRGTSRFGFEVDRTALKDGAAVVLPLALIVAAAFWLTSHYVRPAPPDVFVMSTGPQGGAYHVFGQRYRDILARDGVRIELRPSVGSIENLKRLADPSSSVEAAFVQGGVASQEATSGLLSLGAIYYEPLWIFYRAERELELAGGQPQDREDDRGDRGLDHAAPAAEGLGQLRADQRLDGLDVRLGVLLGHDSSS